MRHLLFLTILAILPGCAPLMIPMTPRLNPDEQHGVDQMWENLLMPVDRVDRQTLLDANVAFCLFAVGVDRLHMTSEKFFAGGKVMMEIDCDAANPAADQYTISIQDRRGKTIRRERYSRGDVEDSAEMIFGVGRFGPNGPEAATRPTIQPTTCQSETPEMRKRRQEMERRQAAVIAATQPARLEATRTGRR